MEPVPQEKAEKEPVGLVFSCSPYGELAMVKYVLSRLPFYKKENYKNVNLPSGLGDDTSTLADDEILEKINAEHDSSFFDEKKKQLETGWEREGEIFLHELGKLGLPLQKSYRIQMTRYGVGGNYWPPNNVILEMNGDRDFLRVTFHEIVHVTIYDLLSEFDIETTHHWQKELLVELIMQKCYRDYGEPSYNFTKASTKSGQTEEIQKDFDGLYPDLRKIVERVHTRNISKES